MKKSIRIIGMAALVMLLAVSCKKGEQEGSKKITVAAGIESAAKTYTHVEDDYIETFWKAGDEIMANGNKLEMKELLYGGARATFEGNWEGPEPNGHVQLHYITPVPKDVNIPVQKQVEDGSWVSLAQVPRIQDYISEVDGQCRKFMDDLPMAISSATTQSVMFRNLTTVFRIRVYYDNQSVPGSGKETHKISKVTMKKNTGDPIGYDANNWDGHYDNYPLSASIYWPHVGEDSAPLAEIIHDDNESYTVELRCENPVELSTSKANPTDFYFVTWPVQIGKGLIFEFYDEEGKVFARLSKKILEKDTVEQSRIYTLCDNSDETVQDPIPYNLYEWQVNK